MAIKDFFGPKKTKRIKIRKKEKERKHKDLSEYKYDEIRSTIDKLEIKTTGKTTLDDIDFKTYRPPKVDNETIDENTDEEKTETYINSDEKVNTNLVSFDHKLTDFEIKLKYLNLKDTDGREYGKLFPPIKSKIVIVDDEGRKYQMTKAGVNQLSGNLLSLIKSNDFKVGDVISIEYDRESKSENGRYIVRIKNKE
jgi:hypothetical protein